MRPLRRWMGGRPTGRVAERFNGAIAGLGTTSGTRLVVGIWPESPFGSFADVMIEDASGHRILLAPSEQVATFVAATYQFDEVRVESVIIRRDGPRWNVTTDSLTVDFRVGRRPLLGWLLRAVPRVVAITRWWAVLINPIASLVMPGVRTIGTAGGRRREWYSALDLHHIRGATARWGGADLGGLTAVEPAVRFGFGSTPVRPSLTRVITTVESPPGDPLVS